MVMLLITTAFLFFIACENSTRSLTDKDSTDADNATITDTEEVVPDDGLTTDGLATDELLSDEVTTDEIVTDEVVTDNEQPDTPVIADDTPIVPDNDTQALTCADITCDVPHSHCEEGQNGADASCECDTGYHWNSGQCVPNTLTKIGEFSFDFTGIINTSTDPMQLKGGNGTVNFSHFNDTFTYSKISVFGDLGFPMATLQNGDTVTVVWLEKLSMSGTVKFFAFAMPQNQNTPGTKQMAATQSMVMFGDMAMSGGNMSIQCIRSASAEGSYTIAGDSGNGSLHITTASGNLYDPKVAEGNLPAPICKE